MDAAQSPDRRGRRKPPPENAAPHRVVISEFMDEAALERFGAGFSITYAPTLVDDRPALLNALAKADALIVRNRTRVDADVLAAAPNLRVVGRLGVGLDNIDLETCAERGITVCPATGANTLSVAEYVIATAMLLRRGAYNANAAMLAGDWPRNALIGGEVSGAVMGLFGFGGIARAVTARAEALGMQIAAYDPHLPGGAVLTGVTRHHTAAALLANADILSLHIPLTPQTRGIIDAPALAQMKPGAILINTARGGVVDEAALAQSLRSGHLGGAALDVFESEPLTREAAAVFKDTPNLILTPHIAGVTRPGNIRVSDMTVENVKTELLKTLRV